jgi:high-affinity iron transporter
VIRKPGAFFLGLATALAVACIVAVLVWQGITAGGAPDPTAANTRPAAAALDIGILVFREGLECVLVLAAITANMVGERRSYQRPVFAGVAIGVVATVLTWQFAVRVIDDLMGVLPALQVQAITGLIAIIVLLVVMNWFFHKVYWTGWISRHTKRKEELMAGVSEEGVSKRRLLFGLALLGFSSLYREGFEVVLFLQSYRLKLGPAAVLSGVTAGLILTIITASLTFVAHRRLPYRRMLILTGILLGGVLLVMVGEQAQEMQLAHWLPTTTIAAFAALPPWLGLWFAVFPTVETLTAQAIALVLVLGSYMMARTRMMRTVHA